MKCKFSILSFLTENKTVNKKQLKNFHFVSQYNTVKPHKADLLFVETCRVLPNLLIPLLITTFNQKQILTGKFVDNE